MITYGFINHWKAFYYNFLILHVCFCKHLFIRNKRRRNQVQIKIHSVNHKINFYRQSNFSASIYLLKVNNRNTRTRFEICSSLTIKTPERRPKITIKTPESLFTPCSSASNVNFEQVNAGWVTPETSNWTRCNKILVFILLHVLLKGCFDCDSKSLQKPKTLF